MGFFFTFSDAFLFACIWIGHRRAWVDFRGRFRSPGILARDVRPKVFSELAPPRVPSFVEECDAPTLWRCRQLVGCTFDLRVICAGIAAGYVPRQ